MSGAAPYNPIISIVPISRDNMNCKGYAAESHSFIYYASHFHFQQRQPTA